MTWVGLSGGLVVAGHVAERTSAQACGRARRPALD